MRFHFGRHHCHEPSGLGRGGPEHRGFGGRGGRPRMFEQGDLRFVILKLLSDKPAHGYEIIKAVEERFGGGYAPSPGIVYPTLTLLEELGQIAVVQTDGARKLFDITADGRAVLEANRPITERIFTRMDEMRSRMGGDMSPKIRRGMENVKTALRLRLERGPLSEADADRIADALDAVAKAIEV
ncbi:PadR family transcriptional regulator [Beijerinckia sp. L45]|uniref:PadR family transcriptional regulator n=1 Tax=Beijerinckia sp. L45 TaxID=1641855 RepID=UPI00131E056D|nr:PadR family transcriptional regulator [Beijerinckia sp. L45]